MRGKLITLHVDGHVTTLELDRRATYDEIKSAIGGGLLESVPYLETYYGVPCWAVCDEEGKIKNLPYNHQATYFWWLSLGKPARMDDVLCGDVVICIGDKEFMSEL